MLVETIIQIKVKLFPISYRATSLLQQLETIFYAFTYIYIFPQVKAVFGMVKTCFFNKSFVSADIIRTFYLVETVYFFIYSFFSS